MKVKQKRCLNRFNLWITAKIHPFASNAKNCIKKWFRDNKIMVQFDERWKCISSEWNRKIIKMKIVWTGKKYSTTGSEIGI